MQTSYFGGRLIIGTYSIKDFSCSFLDTILRKAVHDPNNGKFSSCLLGRPLATDHAIFFSKL